MGVSMKIQNQNMPLKIQVIMQCIDITALKAYCDDKENAQL